MSSSTLVAIALGSNLGDRDAHLDAAVARLSEILSDILVSSRHVTAPVDVVGEQPTYLNAALVGRTSLEARELLRELQGIEAAAGRERPYPNAPRTLDVDLILYGDVVLGAADLELPHPRFRERAFVLEPLAEVAPWMVDPVTGLSIRQLAERLRP